MGDGDRMRIELPRVVVHVLSGLAERGGDAVLVGGCVRDLVAGEPPGDWDVATSLPPESVAAAFPGSSWQNPFGTVTVSGQPGEPGVEVTTFRVEEAYRDRRRPDSVRWGTSLEEDLARRDFTINAMAWRPTDLDAGEGVLVDPHQGAADLERRVLRAVGDPDQRVAEDALRLVRAVRFAVRYRLALEPATAAAIQRNAEAAAMLSGERVRDELLRMLRFPAPSAALALMEDLGLLAVLLPELAALREVEQDKALPGDALDHSLRTMDALPADDPVLRLAGLLHDLGKATTLAGGHFIGHEEEGVRLAGRLLHRLRMSNVDIVRVTRLIRHHMFNYGPEWTDAAVRRFVRRVGADLLDDLLALRVADNAASGAVEGADGGVAELERRARHVLAGDALEQRQLAVNGHDLVAGLGLRPGPEVGRILDRLMDAVLDDPALNSRERLLALARGELAASGESGAAVHREGDGAAGAPG